MLRGDYLRSYFMAEARSAEVRSSASSDGGGKFENVSIDTSKREALCFAEHLMICAKNSSGSNTKPVGGYCVSVEKIGTESQEFLVNVAASMSVEDHFVGGSKLIGTITANFQCLEEKRNEYLHCTDGNHEKCLFIGSEDDVYHIRYEMSCPCSESSSSNDIPMKNHSRLFSEAGNIVLMRYLALVDYYGSLTTESVTIDGRIETSDYRCTSAVWQKLDGRRMEIYSLERRRRDGETVRESKTLLTRQGRILRHEWLDLPYLLRINPLLDPQSLDKNYQRPPLHQTWPDDMELLSKYLDRKTCIIAQETSYFAAHPDIKKLIADYTQSLLIGIKNTRESPLCQYTFVKDTFFHSVKPVDVIGFTVQHFRSFASHPETFEEIGDSSDL